MARIIQTFTDFGNREWKEKLYGGKADGKMPEDFPEDDLRIGNSVEREHSSNPDIATEIAMDHLSEDPDYYDKLIASGIASEKEPNDLFNKLKGKNAREKAMKDIIDYMEEDDEFDYEDLEDEDDFDENDLEDEDDFDYEEDELGTDKADIEDDEENELIFDDEDEPKNKKHIMEKSSIKKYESFIKEAKETVQPTSDPGPGRAMSKENKYKFQMTYDKKIADKLVEYGFTFYVPDDEKDKATKPTKGTHNIIIDMLNLTYSVVDNVHPEIKRVEPKGLDDILKNL